MVVSALEKSSEGNGGQDADVGILNSLVAEDVTWEGDLKDGRVRSLQFWKRKAEEDTN